MISSSPLSRLVLALDTATPSSKISAPDNLKSYFLSKNGENINDSESSFGGAFQEANKQFLEWSKNIHDDLNQQRKERLKQVKWAFSIASISLTLGCILIFTGIILMFFVNLPVGSVTAAASIVSNLVSGIAFSFNKRANVYLSKITEELSAIEKSYLALHFISQITDQVMRDKAVDELAKSLYKKTTI